MDTVSGLLSWWRIGANRRFTGSSNNIIIGHAYVSWQDKPSRCRCGLVLLLVAVGEYGNLHSHTSKNIEFEEYQQTQDKKRRQDSTGWSVDCLKRYIDGLSDHGNYCLNGKRNMCRTSMYPLCCEMLCGTHERGYRVETDGALLSTLKLDLIVQRPFQCRLTTQLESGV